MCHCPQQDILNDLPCFLVEGCMKTPKTFFFVEPLDLAFFAYLTAMSILLLIFGENIPNATQHLIIHAGFFATAVLILVLNDRRSSRLLLFCRIWYIPFLYFFVFEEVGQIIHMIQPNFCDPWVLDLEARAFGDYPTVWFQYLATPWLTEIMSLFYMSYYFLIPGLGLPLYFARKWDELNDLILTTSVTFFFCYLHYIFMPVAGPIFIPERLPFDLVSLSAGPFTMFEQWIFFKGSIQGAAFPSSHVAVAVAILVLAVKHKRAIYVFSVVVTGLAISTVYNGYHYGVDVIYGAIIGLVFALASPGLNRIWKRLWKIPKQVKRW